MTDFFRAPGQFYRGNLHTHSNRSDGVLDAGEVCRRYAAEGYDFICLSDHFIGLFNYPITDTSAYRTDRFTTILGAELHSGAMENGELWHILAVGLPEDFTPPRAPTFFPEAGQETGPALAARAVEAGAFVAIAHPEWSNMTTADAMSIESAHAVEVYNHGCARAHDRPHGFYTLDQMLAAGRRLNLIATDDAHFSEPDHFGGWVMVKAQANEPEALLEALKAGHFYASTGPDIYAVTWEEDRVVVACSAAVSVTVLGKGSASKAVHGESMTRCEVTFDYRFEGCDWLRLTVTDRAGKRAWTNPHYRSI